MKLGNLLHPLHGVENPLQLSDAHHAPRSFCETDGRQSALDGARVLAIGMDNSAIEVVHGHGTQQPLEDNHEMVRHPALELTGKAESFFAVFRGLNGPMFNLGTFHLRSCLRSHVKEITWSMRIEGPTPTYYLPKRCVPNLLRSTNTWVPDSKGNFELNGLGHLNRNIEHNKSVCRAAKKKGTQNDIMIHAKQNPGQNDRSLLEPERYFQYARFIPTCVSRRSTILEIALGSPQARSHSGTRSLQHPAPRGSTWWVAFLKQLPSDYWT